MNKRGWVVCLSGLLIGGASLAGAEELAQGNTRFALELYRKLGAGEGNLFFSPYSISAALAMTSAGARGQTLKEMSSVLHLPPDPHAAFGRLDDQISVRNKPYTLNVANRIWPRKGLDFYPSFLSTVKSHYGAEPQALDFGNNPEGSRDTINRWVSDRTAQKIKDLIPLGILNKYTGMVLTNAIYFKGFWESAFEKGDTKKEDFFPAAGAPVKVDMMTKKGSFPYAEPGGIQILELPYKGNEVSMVILLPKKGDPLANVEKIMTPEQLSRWISSSKVREVQVHLPRFTSRFKAELSQPLKQLGMPTAFNERNADFGAMRAVTPDDNLYIAKVIHEAFVAVDEEGTEAAAATAIVAAHARSIAPPLPTFRADRPFLYLIRHRSTGTVLFIGRMVRPGS